MSQTILLVYHLPFFQLFVQAPCTLNGKAAFGFLFPLVTQHASSPSPPPEPQSVEERRCTPSDEPPRTCDPQPSSAHRLVALALHAGFALPGSDATCLSGCLPIFPSSLHSSNMLLTNHLRSSRPGWYRRFADSFCIRFKAQPFLPSHTQQLPPRDRSSHNSITAHSSTLTKASCPADIHSESRGERSFS